MRHRFVVLRPDLKPDPNRGLGTTVQKIVHGGIKRLPVSEALKQALMDCKGCAGRVVLLNKAGQLLKGLL